jgi:Na+/melibiose symporter-like transporter
MVCLAISSYSFGATALIFCMMFIHIMELAEQSLYAASTKKMIKVQLLVILRIFEENQNLVDMYTSIMCINIIQNIKAVAPKL